MVKAEIRYRVLFRDIVRELNVTREAVDQAADVQWRRPPTYAEDPLTRRQRGGYSDPTGETAIDDRRLEVRRAMKQGERTLQHCLVSIRTMNDALLTSTKKWGAGPWDSE